MSDHHKGHPAHTLRGKSKNKNSVKTQRKSWKKNSEVLLQIHNSLESMSKTSKTASPQKLKPHSQKPHKHNALSLYDVHQNHLKNIV